MAIYDNIYDNLREAFSGDYQRAAPQKPILMGQSGVETLGDPRLTQLYFGTAGQPGYLQQLQSAARTLIGQDVPLQQTAGLSGLEQSAIQQAQSGIGAYQPFLTRQEDLLNEAITGLRGTAGREYDPRFTKMFMDPYESSVVQQTIDDALQAAAQQDIMQRASDIARGGESAFGSRARLAAGERQRALGRGLAESISGIRSRGFGEAQRLGLGEFGRQLQTQANVSSGIANLGRQFGQLGGYGQQLGQAQRQELMNLGQLPRNIQEQQFQRQFAQQTAQQQRPLGVLSGIGGLLPGYRATAGTISSTYGLPRDPLTAGLQGAAGLYGGMYQNVYG